MHNIKQINNILNNIIQKSSKCHKICCVSIKKKQDVFFLNYLWYNKIIYGYTLKNHKNYIIYMKYKKANTFIKFTKINKIINNKSLLKQKLWSKNNFYLINTIKGFQNISKTVSLKIGGYIHYTLS